MRYWSRVITTVCACTIVASIFSQAQVQRSESEREALNDKIIQRYRVELARDKLPLIKKVIREFATGDLETIMRRADLVILGRVRDLSEAYQKIGMAL